MYFLSALLAAVPLVAAQAATAVTDPASGIAFQSFSSPAGMTFGIALPKAGNDFIGTISAPAGLGWAGGDLGPTMTGKILVVAWANGETVQGSIRVASRKSNPPEYTNGVTLQTIAKGTFAKADSWQYTFLCKGCLANATLAFPSGAAEARLGWAASANKPSQASSKGSPLNFHNKGAGSFSASLSAARSDSFDAWAGLAA